MFVTEKEYADHKAAVEARYVELAEELSEQMIKCMDWECKTKEVDAQIVIAMWLKKNKNSLYIDMDKREVRRIRVKFLNLRDQRRIIKRMSAYDDSKTFHDNCVDFLKEMEKQGRLEELAKLIDEE